MFRENGSWEEGRGKAKENEFFLFKRTIKKLEVLERINAVLMLSTMHDWTEVLEQSLSQAVGCIIVFTFVEQESLNYVISLV